MKILQLKAEAFKRLSVVEITPDGNMVQITGKNRQGKTSVLDAIWVALAGAEHIQAVPVKRGEDKATITLTLGGDKPEMIVTRTIRNKKAGDGYTPTLTVENADGFRAPSPQAMLDGLMNALTLDPLALLRAEPKKQLEHLRRLIPGLDFDQINAAIKQDYDARTAVNRDAKRARMAADAVQVPDTIAADQEPIDEAALTDELAKAGKHNTGIDREKARREAIAQKVTNLRNAADDEEASIPQMKARNENMGAAILADHEKAISLIQEQIAGLHKQIEERQEAIVRDREAGAYLITTRTAEINAQAKSFRDEADAKQSALDAADPIPDPIDTEELAARINTARWTNDAIRLRDQRAALTGEAEQHEARAKALTDAMAAREKEKADAIAAADLPVAGLGISEDGLTLNDLPFDQASDAEQLEAAVAIAMAGNPRLRVIRIRDGSLLDADALAHLAKIAEEKQMQCWIESVSDTGKVGFVMEDGHVASTPESRAQPDMLADAD